MQVKKMDSRRPTTNAPKSYPRKTYFKKDTAFGERKYHSRDNRFQSRDDRYQDRDNRFQKRDGKFHPGRDRFQSNKRFESKGKSFKPWDRIDRPRIISDMQVTDGKHRGKYLQNNLSPKARLTPRRIREIMFRIVFRRIRAGRFLDLCAGSGMVGIEAISRGAMLGTFVERSAKMCSFIKKNLTTCGIKDGHGEVVEMEAAPFLKRIAKRRRFWDVIFFDPPYDSDYEEALKYLSRGAGIKPRGVLVIEHPSEMFFPESIGVMKRWRVILQGDSAISFYERK
jgi:16S rRNA (guanine(966)-N(2))-methyltransferase RsmD